MVNQKEAPEPEGIRTGRYRVVKGGWRWIIVISYSLGILLGVNHIFFLLSRFGSEIFELTYYYGLYAAFLPPAFLLFPPTKRSRRDVIPWFDILLFVISLGCLLYFSYYGYDIFNEGWMFGAPMPQTIAGIVLLALVLEAVRRALGILFCALCFFFLIFPIFADQIPPPLTGVGFSFRETMVLQSMGSESIMGIPIRVLGEILLGFLVFGVVMNATGGGKFFLNLSLSLLGYLRGGPAKVAVVGSGFLGSLSGSIATNILTTGSVTIPAMKKLGYPSHYAAAIETAASTGGVLMPPIMGATAFIMAMLLDVPYLHIAVAAAIPSILYYAGLIAQIDAYAAKMGIAGIPRDQLPRLRQTIKEGWYYVFAFLLLIWFVAYMRLEAQGPFYATVALLVLTMIRKDSRIDLRGFIDIIESSGRLITETVSIMAGVSLLIGSMVTTGVTSAFASEIVELAGGNLYILLVIAALLSLVLGTGMTITACYIFLALMIAPTLVELGLNPLAVHLFMLYYGMLSFITPPVCIGAFMASVLAGSPPMRTGFMAMRLGMITYFIPFFFVLNPAMVLQGGSLSEILMVCVTALLGVIIMSGALEGYMWGLGKIGWPARAGAFVSGFLIAIPEKSTDIYGAVIAVLGILVLLGFKKVKRQL